MSNLHKCTPDKFSKTIEKLHSYVLPQTGESSPLISDEVYRIVMEVGMHELDRGKQIDADGICFCMFLTCAFFLVHAKIYLASGDEGFSGGRASQRLQQLQHRP